jgi:hypothetical protein
MRALEAEKAREDERADAEDWEEDEALVCEKTFERGRGGKFFTEIERGKNCASGSGEERHCDENEPWRRQIFSFSDARDDDRRKY